MEMARALKSSDAFETTLQMRLKEEIAGMRFGGCADAIGILPTLLRDYLADKALKSVEGMEMRVEQWLDERKRWHESVKAAVSAGECRRLRTTLAGKIEGLLEKLRGFKGDCPAAAECREHVLNVLDDLLSIDPAHMDRATCYRCDADLTLHPDIESEIEKAVKIAAWSGWPADLVRARLRPVLAPGDVVLRSDHGAIAVRRADGSLFAVRKTDD
ncbi:hypothetical protein [Candidatus Binatus sp.]|jgi:hypothetical protein|uniref:hypothetical protein n=1 Tax=Candidatus Binatus sp. TaxID=2811406 RepID=UPI003C87A02A